MIHFDPILLGSDTVSRGYVQLLNVLKDCSAVMGCLNLKMKALEALQTLESTHPVTRHHIHKEMNLQQHCCMYLRSPHQTYNFMQQGHYCEHNSSAGQRTPSFFMATESSHSCSEG